MSLLGGNSTDRAHSRSRGGRTHVLSGRAVPEAGTGPHVIWVIAKKNARDPFVYSFLQLS